MKKNSGITLISLVVTILLLLILAGVGTYSGIEAVNTSKYTKFKTELKIMQSYVNNWYEELLPQDVFSSEYDTQFNQNIIAKFETEIGATKASSNTPALVAINDTANYNDYYILDTNQKNTLKIEGVDQKVLVNIKKRKVVSYDGFKKQTGQQVYVLDDNNEEIYNVEFSKSEVRDMDQEAPKVTIKMEKSSNYLFSIKSTIEIQENMSGIDYSKCKYVYTNSSTPIGTDVSTYTEGTISQEKTTIEKPKAAGTYYLHVLAGDNNGNITETVSSNSVTIDSKKDFTYTGTVQSATLIAGTYKLEVWGAQGGYRSSSSYGGKGGYSVGTVTFNEQVDIYAYVGGSGNTGGTSGGFNGGGTRATYNGGGGGTDFRINSDSLYARIIVAGGGGSDGATSKGGGYGGGSSGQTRTESYGSGGQGGTQTAAGAGSSGNTPGSFGQGGTGVYVSNGYGGAGGGGWYGGAGAYPDGSGDDDRGGRRRIWICIYFINSI